MSWLSRLKLATALEEQLRHPWQGSWRRDHTCLLQGWRWLGRVGNKEGTSSPEKHLEEETTVTAWVRGVLHSGYIWISLAIPPGRHAPAAKRPVFPKEKYLQCTSDITRKWSHACMIPVCTQGHVYQQTLLHSCTCLHHYGDQAC